LTWPIFDGWATRAKVEQAIIGLKETQLAKEKVVKDIALELKNAYLGLKNAIARIRTVDSELGVYSDNLSGVAEKYRQGIASLLDNEDAALKYEISSFNKKQAIYDYIIAQSSFDKATGGT
jgi:outer membrane protein TolC